MGWSVAAKNLKIFFHDNCFDGASSAALFASFYTEAVVRGAEVRYQGLEHQHGDPFAGLELDGDDNACVDFRYCDSERMTWWFDHHASAFQPPSLRAAFEADDSGQKFFDPEARSCTLFEARVLRERFGWEPDDPDGSWAELLHWADLIDGAQFESPAQAVEVAEPALRITTWLERNEDADRTHDLIRLLGRRPLAEIAAEPWIEGPLRPILEQHQRDIELVRQRAVFDAGVVFVDLVADDIGAHNKFIAYLLHPDATYVVSVTAAGGRAKISVGSNPWRPEARQHNIARICERFGGGGHPVVGGVSLAGDEGERAREIARLIRDELSSPPR